MLEQPEYPEIPKCENAQVRSISREVDFAWLAGIIDGEGNIDFSVQTKKGNDYFVPKIRISNTDMRMIKRIAEIYSENNLVFFYHFSDVKRYKNKKDTWKNQMHITIASQGSIKKLLNLVEPFLVNKKALARLMVETIGWVQSQPCRGRMSREGFNYCQRPEFANHIDRMKAERAFHIEPSTTKRRAREIISW